MKKWTTLSPSAGQARWTLLSQALTEKGCANQFTPWTQDLNTLTGLEALSEFDHVRLSTRLAPQILQHVKVQSSWITLLGAVDGMSKTDRGWWPLCALYEAFGQLLVELGQNLETRGTVFLAGAGGAARIATAAFFKAGFQNFLVTDLNESSASNFIREVRAKFFGMEIHWVPMEKIVMLPGESSVIVNCTPSTAENALLRELSYLNFLRRPGFLFDLSRGSKPSPLMVEALDAGVRAVSGIEIAARTDVLWAKWGFQTDLDLLTYQTRLQSVFVQP